MSESDQVVVWLLDCVGQIRMFSSSVEVTPDQELTLICLMGIECAPLVIDPTIYDSDEAPKLRYVAASGPKPRLRLRQWSDCCLRRFDRNTEERALACAAVTSVNDR